jgi:hypothetical protein
MGLSVPLLLVCSGRRTIPVDSISLPYLPDWQPASTSQVQLELTEDATRHEAGCGCHLCINNISLLQG